MMVLPEMQGLAGIMLHGSTNTTGNSIRFDAMQPPPIQMYSSPSTERAVEEEVERRMERKFKMGYEKAMDEVAEKQKVENGKWKYKTVVYKEKKMRTNMIMPGYDPYHEPDEFTLLSNHDFHKLLANFEALLDN